MTSFLPPRTVTSPRRWSPLTVGLRGWLRDRADRRTRITGSRQQQTVRHLVDWASERGAWPAISDTGLVVTISAWLPEDERAVVFLVAPDGSWTARIDPAAARHAAP